MMMITTTTDTQYPLVPAVSAAGSLYAFQTLFKELAFQHPSNAKSITTVLTAAGLAESPWNEVFSLFAQQPHQRLGQYQWMVFANHADALEQLYPYTFQLLNAVDDWQTVVFAYLRQYPPEAFQFFDVSVNFPLFLQEYETVSQRLPFLVDLALYEQLEAAVLKSTAVQPVFAQPVETSVSRAVEALLHAVPVVNPTSVAYSSHFDIEAIVAWLKQTPTITQHTIPATLLLPAATPLYLWIYRDASHACRFVKLSPLVHGFLALALQFQETDVALLERTYGTLLETVCFFQGVEQTPALEQGFMGFLATLQTQEIVMGSVLV
jgi:hypothetical protein